MRSSFALPVLALAAAACAPAAPASSAPSAASAALLADTVRESTVAPGLRHLYLWDAAGPWAVNVVEVDGRACGLRLHTIKAGDQLRGRATTSELARQAEQRWRRPALAAINADFFSFDPPGVPIGAQVVDGEIVRGPADRPVFGLTEDGVPFIGRIRVRGELRTGAGFAAPVAHVNVRPGGDALTVYDRFVGGSTPTDTGAVEIVAHRLPHVGGDTVRAVAVSLDTVAAGVAMPEGGVVLAGRGAAGAFLRHVVVPGDTLEWWLRLEPAPGRVREMVGGFPRLLEDGAPVHHLDPAVRPPFGDTRHPRTAIGWRPDGTLLLVTVDGRQPPYSAGMSLGELAELFLRLGAVEAINLDGGGSTAMVVQGSVVNRPSDREGERANANAIVILGPAAGTDDGTCRL
jgi:large repetitive protein